MTKYYVQLKANISFNTEIGLLIKDVELKTPEERIIEEIDDEVYGTGTESECLTIIEAFDSLIKKYFEVCSYDN